MTGHQIRKRIGQFFLNSGMIKFSPMVNSSEVLFSSKKGEIDEEEKKQEVNHETNQRNNSIKRGQQIKQS